MGLCGVTRIGEQITLMGTIEGDLSWQDAEWLGLVMLGHAREARRRQFMREGRCVDCGAPPGAPIAGKPEICGDNCPGWKVQMPEEVAA